MLIPPLVRSRRIFVEDMFVFFFLVFLLLKPDEALPVPKSGFEGEIGSGMYNFLGCGGVATGGSGIGAGISGAGAGILIVGALPKHIMD